jgi:hypothetical protein
MSAHEKAVEAAARAIYDALPNFSMQWQPNTAGGYSQHRVDEPYGIDGVRVRQCNDQARAAITAYLASMQEQGWVMVPVEPTEAMLNAAMDDLDWWLKPNEGEAAKLNGEQKTTLSSVYAAMLAAKEE